MSKVEAKIKILSWMTGSVIYESEKATTIKEAVIEANLYGANLHGADLHGANLYKANLHGANLYGADLRGANLYKADLHGADLRGANLRGADLHGADLHEADLYGADLYEADLRGADLHGADLRGANLYGANLYKANLRGANLHEADLRGADLHEANLYGANLYEANLRGVDLNKLPTSYINQCSRDMLFVFEHLKSELPGLRQALVDGKINGTQYEGDCACLIGTLAKVDGGLKKVCEAIPFYDKGMHNPCEQWFYQIREGDTPENNQFAAHALKLIDSVLGADAPEHKSATKSKKG